MELSAQARLVLEFIEETIRKGMSETEAAARAKVMMGQDDVVDQMIAYRHEIAAQQRRIASGHAFVDPEDEPGSWYTGPGEMDVFWPALKATLTADPGWKGAVPSLDGASTDVVALLADPHSATIRTRGLVLGFVQSGKTANFTATIAKAADAGYRLFIVLSGVHNSLRRQTQLRIDEHLVDQHPTRWLGLTDETRDFGRPVKALPLLASSSNLRLIAVVKKNVSRLTSLRDWLREADKHGGLESSPILIIDDEADQASPNAAKDPELNQTKINERLRDLLELPRVAYVGYTATPFANVLINPQDAKDIYPRSFIYSLPKPATYFGARELFGSAVSEEEVVAEDEPHDLIRIVPDDEAMRHSSKTLLAEGPEVTASLEVAIAWFVLATAARRVRSGAPKHSSMLVHTTMRVGPQLSYITPIRAFVKRLDSDVAAGRTEALRQIWDDETEREPAERHGLAPVSFDELSVALPATLEELRVLADNGQSTERLVYSEEPATVIAVGGNTLSRGLTLEGLVSSFFLRGSNTYDTLLQMGRWFGYRAGYADLPRIWTTEQLADDFEFLADVEDALRAEIERYRTMDGATPANLPVRIRLHPKMKATSRVKMHFAVPGDASFSAQRPQTTYFDHKNQHVLSQNISAVRGLMVNIKQAAIAEDVEDSKVVLRDVPVDLIKGFIRGYHFNEDSELTGDLLLRYMDGQNEAGALERWNVAVIGRQSPEESLDLGLAAPSPLITRSKLKRQSTPARAVIGTLMSKPDRVADLVPAATVKPSTSDAELQSMRDEDRRGLLVIYPIDRKSEPKVPGERRVRLDAEQDLIGVAFCFPTAPPNTEPTNTIQVVPIEHLPDPDSDPTDEEYVDVEGSQDDVDLGDGI